MTHVFPGDAEYAVTAVCVAVRCAPDGHYEMHYQGARLPASVDPRQIKTLLDGDMIAPLPKG